MDPSPKMSLLEELDGRQDEVLQQLDELNSRIEQLIAEWTRSRQADGPEESDNPSEQTSESLGPEAFPKSSAADLEDPRRAA